MRYALIKVKGPDDSAYCDMNQGNEIVAVKDRKLWRVFHDIDQKRYTLETSNFAKSIIGINKWSDVIPNFRWKSLEQ